MHVGVKILDQQGWTSDRDIIQWLPFPTVDDTGKVSVGEIRQDDLAFRMNTSSRKVLKEVWFGLLITEPDMGWCRIRRHGCPRTKRVPGRSGFAFKCHRSRLTQTKEREGERDNQKSFKQQKIYQNIVNRKNICMRMHEHVTCKGNCIMGLAQSNPTSTQSVAHI